MSLSPEQKRQSKRVAILVYGSVLVAFLLLCVGAVVLTSQMERNRPGFHPIVVKQPISFIDRTYLPAPDTAAKPATLGRNATSSLQPVATTVANSRAVQTQVDAATIKGLFPQLRQGPLVLSFHANYCHDCRALAPVLTQRLAKFPQVQQLRLEVSEDRQRLAAVFQTFRPVTVPVVLFIQPTGHIFAVLDNIEPRTTLAQRLDTALNGLGKMAGSVK
jgi:thiol:disulfide interchange protein